MWQKPDADERIVAGQELDELLERAFGGEMDLIYFDQAGFNLWAKIVYAWQQRGKRTIVPVMKGRLQNVLGFMWHGCQKFESFVFEGNIDAGVIVHCIDLVAARLRRKSVIVVDNAPMHTSQEFDDRIEEWEKLGLTVFRLPSYCPELNKIEMLWQKIKYDWLTWEAYKSEKSLRTALDEVLAGIGSKYKIIFR